jgi:hypothetical protein
MGRYITGRPDRGTAMTAPYQFYKPVTAGGTTSYPANLGNVVFSDTSAGKKLGRLPSKSDTRALMFSRFAQPRKALPPRTNFWPRRTGFPLRSFGNREVGDCTIASQANAAMRMERLETRRTPQIADEEAKRVYFAMTERLYGGGDTGAYETDALNNWRDPALTFKDTKGRPLTIDAYVRINASDVEEIKNALVTAAQHGIKFCISLPNAFQDISPPNDWAIPDGQALLGDWQAGSWGGHSMYGRDYDEIGMWFAHSWEEPDQRITWPAVMAYVDEVHLPIDSLDAWRQKPGIKKVLDLPGLKAAVNKVSSQKIA